MIIELTGIVTPLIYELGKDLVKEKLLPAKAKAGRQMEVVLFELKLVYETMNRDYERYRLLTFNNQTLQAFSKRELDKILKIDYTKNIDNARGHCSKITSIYEMDLKRWFSRVFAAEEAKKLNELFDRIKHFDYEMMQHLENFSKWLKSEAEKTVALVSENKFEEAESQVIESCLDIYPSISKVKELLLNIERLQKEWHT